MLPLPNFADWEAPALEKNKKAEALPCKEHGDLSSMSEGGLAYKIPTFVH